MAENKVQLIIEALDKTGDSFKNLQRNLGGISGQVAGLQTAFRGLLASAPFLALGAMIKQTVNAGEELLKMSKQTGITVENLSRLKQVAELSETDIGTLTKGIGFFNKALYGVNDEGKDTTNLLRQLGVTAKDPYQALLQVADAFSNMEDGSGKSAIAMELFGRGGRELIPMLNEGREAVTRMSATMTTEGAKAADEFSDNITKLKHNLEGLRNMFIGPMVESTNTFADSLRGLSKMVENEGLLKGYAKWATTGKEGMNQYLKQQGMITEEKKPGDKKAAPLLPDKKETEEWPNALRQLQAQLAATTPGVSEFAKKEAAVDKTIGDLIQKFPKHTKQLREFQEALKGNIAGQQDYEARKAYTDSVYQVQQKLKEMQLSSLSEISKEESKQYNERLNAQQSTADNIIKLSEDAAVARVKIAKGDLAASLKQYDIEKQHIMEAAQNKLSVAGLTAEETKLIEQEKYAALIGLGLRYRDALLASNASLTDGLSEGFKKYTQELKTTFQQGVEIARATASAMEGAFSDFFFDVMQGKLKSFADYLRSFLTGFQRALAQAMSQKLVGSILSSIGGAGGTGPGGNAGIHELSLLTRHGGGYIPRLHFGGLRSDERTTIMKVGERGITEEQNEWLTGIARTMRGNNPSQPASVPSSSGEVHNYYYIQAVDAKSFADLVERNPGAITKIMQDDARRGGSLWR